MKKYASSRPTINAHKKTMNNQKFSTNLKEIITKPSRLDSKGGSPRGTITQKKLNNKRSYASNSRSRIVKPFRAPDENDNSDHEFTMENPYLKRSTVGTTSSARPKDIHSNIDGYSQSDLWDKEESKGYLQNSRKLLDRFKRSPDPRHDTRKSFESRSPPTRSRGDRIKVITSKIVKNSNVKSVNKRKLGSVSGKSPKRVHCAQIRLDNEVDHQQDKIPEVNSVVSKEVKKLNLSSSQNLHEPMMNYATEEEIVEIIEHEVTPCFREPTAINALSKTTDRCPGELTQHSQKVISSERKYSSKDDPFKAIPEQSEGFATYDDRTGMNSSEKLTNRKIIQTIGNPSTLHLKKSNMRDRQDLMERGKSNKEHRKPRSTLRAPNSTERKLVKDNRNKSSCAKTEQNVFSPARSIEIVKEAEEKEQKFQEQLDEKQKMLEKYESMLQKVNVEFQNTLDQNKSLNEKISMLELRCLRAESKVNGPQEITDTQQYSLKRQIDELILEKNEIHQNSMEQIKSKNEEIDKLQKIKLELEQALARQAEEIAESIKESVKTKATLEELQKQISTQNHEIKQKYNGSNTDVNNYDLSSQTLRRELEQVTFQRDDLVEQNKALKEQSWKDDLATRQILAENESLKREVINLRSNIELSRETESECKAENTYLKETSLAQERKVFLYQNIIAQADQFHINLSNNLQSSLELLRTSDEVNRGLVLIKIEKMLEDVRNYRLKSKSKIEQMLLQSPVPSSFELQKKATDLKYNTNPLSYSQDTFSGFKLDMNFSQPRRTTGIEIPSSRGLNTNIQQTKMSTQVDQEDKSIRQAVPEKLPSFIDPTQKAKKDKLDPALMKPAGIRSSQENQYY
ncbi:unnamed protein product [Moneuplotes crassus]|uniref:Uncharacterized protein n=1 Tax=Euplotes crassus TaxID=5936 RepID=A0AAD2D317_EUPCR|nr:unnamed protein product [Moneuplotes crassus]